MWVDANRRTVVKVAEIANDGETHLVTDHVHTLNADPKTLEMQRAYNARIEPHTTQY